VRAVYDLIYGQGIQPDSPEGLQEMAQVLEIANPELIIKSSEIKDILRSILKMQ